MVQEKCRVLGIKKAAGISLGLEKGTSYTLPPLALSLAGTLLLVTRAVDLAAFGLGEKLTHDKWSAVRLTAVLAAVNLSIVALIMFPLAQITRSCVDIHVRSKSLVVMVGQLAQKECSSGKELARSNFIRNVQIYSPAAELGTIRIDYMLLSSVAKMTGIYAPIVYSVVSRILKN